MCNDPTHGPEALSLTARRSISEGSVYLLPGAVGYFAVWSGVAASEVIFTGVMMRPDGTLSKFAQLVQVATARTWGSKTLQLGEGLLLYLTASDTVGNSIFGNTYCYAGIAQGPDQLSTAYIQTGLVTLSINVAVSLIPYRPFLVEQTGVLTRVATGTNPIAQAEISQTVPTGVRWRLVTMRATLVTDANAANRVVTLTIVRGSDTIYSVTAATAQTASLTNVYQWSNATHLAEVVGTARNYRLPWPLWLDGGDVISTSTAAMQVADDWAAPIFTIEEVPQA